MQDFKGILQGAIVAVLVVIAGLLFSISRKLDNQKAETPAAQAAPAPVQPAQQTPIPPVATNVPPPASAPVRKPSPAKPSPAPVTQTAKAELPAPIPAPIMEPPLSRGKNDTPIPAASAAPPIPEPYVPPAPVAAPPPPPPPAPRIVTLPAGTSFTVRLLDRIDSERNRQGDTFQTSLEEPLVADGVVVAQRGASVLGRLVQARQSGRVSGVAEVTLELQRLTTIAGDQPILTDVMQKEAPKTQGRDAAKVGIFSGIGAVIGAIAGGGKGAAIGAGAGAGGGVIDVLATKGKPIKLDPETRLTFRLRAPLSVNADGTRTPAQALDNSYPTNQNGPQTDRADRPYLRRRPQP